MKKIVTILTAFLLCVSSSFAYDFVDWNATDEFYLYNVADGTYVKNNNGQMIPVATPDEASPCKFSQSAGAYSLKIGEHYLQLSPNPGQEISQKIPFVGTVTYTKDPGESASGYANLSTTDSKFNMSGDASSGFLISTSKTYGLTNNTKRTYYFYKKKDGSAFSAIQAASGSEPRWKLVYKKEVDNTITVSPASVSLQTYPNSTNVKSFQVGHNGAPSRVIISAEGQSLTIENPSNPQVINVEYKIDASGSQSITLVDKNNSEKYLTLNSFSGTSAEVDVVVATNVKIGSNYVAYSGCEKTIKIVASKATRKKQTISWSQDAELAALSLTQAPFKLTAKALNENGVERNIAISYHLSSENGVVKIGTDQTLYVLKEGTVDITAIADEDAEYIEATKRVTVNVSGIPADSKTITSTDAASTGIYTGTIGGPSASYAFHRTKREVDLQKCFDNAGQALFDTLYIFGMTMNTNGALVSYTGTDGVKYTNVPKINTPSDSVGCNATTPCYVYAKSGNTYVHTRTFDATQTRYDWGTKQNGKHIYFTGYCPFAYVGITPTDEGWMYFKGGEENEDLNRRVDIYLDSCQILGRYKTILGESKTSAYQAFELVLYANEAGADKPNNNYMEGASSPFVFTSLSDEASLPYKPHIHIAGHNHLKGQLGSYITKGLAKANVTLQTGTSVKLDADIAAVAGKFTYSSPITIKPIGLNYFTDLVLDDIWRDGTITNGYVRLDANKGSYKSEKALAVNLGSANGSLTINGGQYHLRNSAADGAYTCNLAFGYQVYSETIEKAGVKVRVDLYGFGGDMTESKVTINSGTFTMYKNMYPDGGKDAQGKPTYLGDNYYRDQVNFLDLRIPSGNGASRINGGTFNGIPYVSMCTRVTTTGASPKNAMGDWLCLHTMPAGDEQPNKSVKVNLPRLTVYPDNEDPYPAYEDPQVAYQVSELSDVAQGLKYGAQSISAFVEGDKQYVRLLLPGDARGEGVCPDCNKPFTESVVYSWAATLPKIDAADVAHPDDPLTVGGEIEIEQELLDSEGKPIGVTCQTNQLLYMDLEGMQNEQVLYSADNLLLSVNPDYQDNPRGNITNAQEYSIAEHINMLKVVQADTWYTFTAPFDIQAVYVIETKNEWKGNINKLTATAEKTKRELALSLQSQDNFGLIYHMRTFVMAKSETNKRTSSFTFDQMLSKPEAKKVELTHYDGSNLMNANYYLYKPEPNDFTLKAKNNNEAKDTFNIAWVPVTADANGVLMHQGQTYAIQFPWCPMCNDLEDRDYYDYWSNKLILFYGKGPQTLYGTSEHSVVKEESVVSGHAKLIGNSTFADMTLSAKTAYVHNQTTDFYELNTSAYIVKPSEGYMIFNSGTSRMPARISRSGEIVYQNNTATDLEGVPTIQDNASLMLFDAVEGFEILSLQAQVVAVYNLQGKVVFHQYMAEGEQVHVAAPAGLYVVKGEKESIKIMVD